MKITINVERISYSPASDPSGARALRIAIASAVEAQLTRAALTRGGLAGASIARIGRAVALDVGKRCP